MKNKESQKKTNKTGLGSWTSAVVTSSKMGEGATSQMYLWVWMRGQTEEEEEEERRRRGGVFFLVLLFVTPLKMYMGITSKLVNRKHPLAIF